jgi:uncharacterized protein (TIGR02001 family)
MLALVLSAVPAWAAAPFAASNLSLQLVSDYRHRGVSLSGRRPAVQGGIEAEGDGWFAAGWASVSASARTGSDVDLAFGRRSRGAGLDWSVSAVAHLFNNAGDPHSVELAGGFGGQIGAARVDVELAYAPRETGGGTANVYFGAGMALPIPATPLSGSLRAGVEHGYFRRKLDWEAAISAPIGRTRLAASLVGARGGGVGRQHGGTGFVLSFGRSW